MLEDVIRFVKEESRMICKILGHKWINPNSTIMMFKCKRCNYNTWQKGYLFNQFKLGWKLIFIYYRIKNRKVKLHTK